MADDKAVFVRGMPSELWLRLRVEAMHRRVDLRELLIEILEQYLDWAEDERKEGRT